MKQIPNSFSWHKSPHWYWPIRDEKLLQVNDWVRDVDVALKHIENRNLVIQAGGACGVWPAYLATLFKTVVTAEPVKENYECLVKNTEMYPNVKRFNCGFSESNGDRIYMQLDDVEKTNAGAYYAAERNGNIPCLMIDKLPLKACDLIILDVEGFEVKALAGASHTLEKFNPVVMIEEKPLPHLKSDQHLYARQFLESIGYKQVDQIHRDVVFNRD